MLSRSGFFLFLLFTLTGCVNMPGPSGPAMPFPEMERGQPEPQGGPFMLGVDVLEAQGFHVLAGRRVGLITNHTSYNSRGQMTRVVLRRAPNLQLAALYAPEHGIDGRAPAGQHVATRRDPVTGLIVHSLYGPTRKPSPSQLQGIDVMVFDLQDIGARSYTYISTMALAMEACAEQGIGFVVLDRPNPLGGHGVFGPGLDPSWKSFVGQIPVPYVHGMTAGELALMINAKGWISARPALHVVRMRGWNRSMLWVDTGLRWHPTSPNIPKPTSPLYYAATGMLGGMTPVDIGIGTDSPFEFAAAEGVDPMEFTAAMNSYGIPGARFQPYVSSRKPGRNGSRVILNPRSGVDPVALDVLCICELHRRVPGGLLSRMNADSLSLFNKVYGGQGLERTLRRGDDPRRLIASWQGFVNHFRSDRQRHLLYP